MFPVPLSHFSKQNYSIFALKRISPPLQNPGSAPATLNLPKHFVEIFKLDVIFAPSKNGPSPNLGPRTLHHINPAVTKLLESCRKFKDSAAKNSLKVKTEQSCKIFFGIYKTVSTI